jgi:benzylsuccinate CoA-transferase BbsF subunit
MAKKALEGVKILDFGTSAVGPESAAKLTWFGATTVRVETSTRLDTARLGGPYRSDFHHPDYTAWGETQNAGKYAITLNLSKPKGREIAWKLVQWADIFNESFTPGAMAKWGLDYESVRKVKPDIIYLSNNSEGQRGPYANWRGWGTSITGIGGIYHFVGWPDRGPSSIYLAYSDFVAPRFGALALAAALAYKHKTGKGQYIDMSQVECCVMYLMPMVMDYFVNGRIQTRSGNRVYNAAPHGCYACQGQERWITIAVTNDDEWRAFREVVGETWAKDPKFVTLLGRKANEDELDRRIGEWTANYVAESLMERLQQAGVPSGVVWNPEDQVKDPQLQHRKHYALLEGHPNIGPFIIDGPQLHLSKTPMEVHKAYGVLGAANEYVYKDILGMSDDEFADCLATGVFD